MEELNIISDNGCGFVVASAGREYTEEEYAQSFASGWVDDQLEQTAKAALDPDYPALSQVLAYRVALRAYRENKYEGERPVLEV